MKRLLGIMLLLSSLSVEAQVVRTFVATSGSDSNPCSKDQPCRTFGAAIAAVSAGGEVVALETGGYGPFTIDKAVSVIAPEGIHAAIAPSSGAAIVVNPPVSGLQHIVLRGLYLNGQGAADGIVFQNGHTLYIEHCVVSNFTGYGIQAFSPRSGARLFVTDSVLRMNYYGARVHSSAAIVGSDEDRLSALFENTRFERNFFDGLVVTSRAVVRNSLASTNSDGFAATGNGRLTIENSLVYSNIFGITADGNAEVRVSNTVISKNDTGLVRRALFPAALISLGNNRVAGNETSGVFDTAVNPQ